MLTLLLVISALVGVASEGFDRLWEAHLLANFVFPAFGTLQPVVWFGVIAIAGNIISFGITEVFRRKLERVSKVSSATVRALMWFNLLSVGAILAFALAGNFWLAFAALLVKGIGESLARPLYNAWLIQHTDSRSRATALSMISQTNALGQIAGGPGVGALGNLSLRLAMATTGILTSASVWFFAYALRREGRTLAPADPPIVAVEAS